MLEETIRASGKFQVEIKSDYRLERDRKDTSYTIETYAFVPNSLDVNPENYPKYLFYRDTQTYIRLRTPVVLLQEIASADYGLFDRLEKNLQELAGNQTAVATRDAENRIRLFCCVLKYSIKDHVALVATAQTPADAEQLVEYYLDNLVRILARFRKLDRVVGQSSMDERIRSIHALADEYISVCVAQYSFDLLEMTRKFGGDNSRGYRGALLGLIRDEERYRAAAGYPSVAAAVSDNEQFIYRRGVLKRLMESILFLNRNVRPEGRITEQVVYSLSAGLAMMFATAVAFLTQQKYGNFTMAFFVALVVSYMFKDRIKELARLYVNRKVQDRYFDQKVHIHGGSGNDRLGFIRERFQFVPEAGLPQEIRSLRDRDPITRFDTEQLGEKIFLYRKNLKIFTRNFETVYHSIPVDGITDIWRIGMGRFVRKMDNPKKPLFLLDGDGYRSGKASKVYHINLVIRYVAAHGEEYKRFRIVLSRNGIKRIDRIENG